MSDQVTSLYDPAWVAGYFDELGEQELERLVKTPAREIQLAVHNDVLGNHILQTDLVLEIGAGPGRFTQSLVTLGAEIVVTDIFEHPSRIESTVRE